MLLQALVGLFCFKPIQYIRVTMVCFLSQWVFLGRSTLRCIVFAVSALSLALQGTQGAGRISHASALRGSAADTSATVGSVVTLSAVAARLLVALILDRPRCYV